MRGSSALSQQYAAAFAAPHRGLPCASTLVRASNKCLPFCRIPTSSAPATPAPLDGEHAPVASDGLFGRAAIAVFRRVMAPHVGWTSPRPGYGGMVDECRMLLAKRTPDEQRQIVLAVLGTLFVAPRGPALFRKYFADKPGVNARITPGFFSWLVGPSTTNDSPEAGGTLGTGVLIEKCRFLDESGCKGLCLNMCQQPTQEFFTETLGLPLRMTPNFETKSCQMSFGVPPLPVKDDPAHQSGCLAACKMSGSFKVNNSNLSPSSGTACYVGKPALEAPDDVRVPLSARIQ